MAEPTVGAGIARALVEMAVARGAERKRLLAHAGVAASDLEDQDARLPLVRYLALLETARDLCAEPALALEFGATVSLAEMSIVALVCETCANAGQALDELNRYSRLMIDDGGRGPVNRLEMRRGDDGTWIELTCHPSVDHPLLTETSFARMAGGFARVVGRPLAREVRVTHGDPGYGDAYERIFQAAVVFGSDRNAMRVDEDFLAFDLPGSNRYVFGILSDRAQALLEELESLRTVRGRVERSLMPILHTGELGIERIAERLGMSRQTLYRRLRAEGLTYKSVLDELRREMALHYLDGGKVSVNEVAYLVGYSEPSAFSRAFRRWTGRAPSRAPEARDRR